MKTRAPGFVTRLLCAPAVALLIALPASGYDVYKLSTDGTAVPDVDKKDWDGDLIWPDLGDNTCWQSAAANVLGAAGYGIGANAQQRAESIYAQLNNDFGIANGGWNERGINYWLYTYGKNPDRPEFHPDNAYTDVTVSPFFPKGLADYNRLLDELARCQYVNVSYQAPGHAMTLIGGDYADPMHPGQPTTSVWHDSDRDRGEFDDNPYTNDFGGGAMWNLTDYLAMDAVKYVTLCPGLNKPEDAVRNYDVAWYLQDPDQDAVWTPDFRVAGEKRGVYDGPVWMGDTTVRIGNEWVPEPDVWKEVYLLVDYKDRVPDRDLLEQIHLVDDNDVFWDPTSVTASPDDGQLLFYWKLDHQPDWEKIRFPNDKYRWLDGDVKDWNLSTICVPEPVTLTLLALGGAALLRRRRS